MSANSTHETCIVDFVKLRIHSQANRYFLLMDFWSNNVWHTVENWHELFYSTCRSHMCSAQKPFTARLWFNCRHLRLPPTDARQLCGTVLTCANAKLSEACGRLRVSVCIMVCRTSRFTAHLRTEGRPDFHKLGACVPFFCSWKQIRLCHVQEYGTG